MSSRKGHEHTLVAGQEQPARLTDLFITPFLLCTPVHVPESLLFDFTCQCFLLLLFTNVSGSFSNVSMPGSYSHMETLSHTWHGTDSSGPKYVLETNYIRFHIAHASYVVSAQCLWKVTLYKFCK